MNLQRLYHTLRHLKRVQITNRIWRKIHPPRFAKREVAPPLRPRHGHPLAGAQRRTTLVGPTTQRVFQQTIELTSNAWNDHELSHLVLYNLHYFDDLVAEGAAERRSWHAALINRWIDENPPGRGAGWEPYPLSLRIVNWIKWALAGNELNSTQLASLATQVDALVEQLEFHLLANHLFANAKALVFAGAFFAGEVGDRWLTRGCELLATEVTEQVLGDGGHYELSPMYHSIILEDLLDLTQLARLYAGVPLLQELERYTGTIDQMRRWLAVMTHPDGEIAFFNDAAFDIAPAPAAIHDYAHRLGFATFPTTFPGATYLSSSGYVRLERDATVVLIDVAEVGPAYQPGHAHADTLSFEWSLGGQRVIVNSGTSCYGISAERLRQRSTAAHSTVVVNGQDSSEVWSGFRVARRAHPYDVRVDESAAKLSVSAAHDGYRRLPCRVRHVRRWDLSAGRFEIQDQLVGNPCAGTAHFHLHPQVQLLPNQRRHQQPLRIDNWQISVEVDQGDLSRVDSTYHPRFDESVPSHLLISRFLAARHNWQATW